MKFRGSFWVQLICAVLIPVFIGLVHPEWIDVVWEFVYIAFLVLPAALILGVVFDWAKGDGALLGYFLKSLRIFPDGLAFGSDLKRDDFPWVTTSLILINTIIFFTLPKQISEALTFLPHGESTTSQDLFSIVSSAFLHGDSDHLLGNMVFLWAFGSSVEPRVLMEIIEKVSEKAFQIEAQNRLEGI